MRAKKPNEKLRPQFYGPFKVLEKVGQVAYRMDLPPTVKIHSEFHVSQFKKLVQPILDSQALPSCLPDEMELVSRPDDIVQTKKLTNSQEEVSVKWKGLPHFENTWELSYVIKRQFSQFYPEDKVPSNGRNNNRAKPQIKQYSRR